MRCGVAGLLQRLHRRLALLFLAFLSARSGGAEGEKEDQGAAPSARIQFQRRMTASPCREPVVWPVSDGSATIGYGVYVSPHSLVHLRGQQRSWQ